MAADAHLVVTGLAKTFRLHLQGGLEIPVVRDFGLAVAPGECVVLTGPSGAGKSTVLKCLYGNYRADAGAVRVRHGAELVDIVRADPRLVLEVRRRSLGLVSQFLRVIPRVPTLEVVLEPFLARHGEEARRVGERRARELLARLNLPERLWSLPPATFSGGEQQRVNIARGLIGGHATVLLDEPTASLDEANRAVVMDLIEEMKGEGRAVIGIFHDPDVRARVATRTIEVKPAPASACAATV